MTTTTTRIIAPECWVIKCGRNYFAAIDWDECDPLKRYIGTPHRDDARTYSTREAALEAAREQAPYFKGLKVLHRKAVTETTLTDEGRQAVRDRRAARKAERGW